MPDTVALVHHYLNKNRGGEKVLKNIAEIYRDSEIFTLFYNSRNVDPFFHNRKIKSTFFQYIPGKERVYKYLLGLFPVAFENLDLQKYKLVISSDSACAKGIITSPESCHICYLHAPMRYVWNLYHEYLNNLSFFSKPIFKRVAHKLRLWDYIAAQRVDHFIANSYNVSNRIKKYYRRESVVIHPPVEIDKFKVRASHDNYYLIISEMVYYKRIDIAVKAFNELKKPLIVIGNGEEFKNLKKIANKNIVFKNNVSNEEIVKYYENCKAFIFPGEEDFGIVMVEAQACGKPVIAYKKGGAAEIVVDKKTGVLFDEQTTESLISAVDILEKKYKTFSPENIRKNSERFSEKIFKQKIKKFVDSKISEFKNRKK